MKPVIIATRNKKKKKELVAILKGMRIRVLSLDEIEENVPEVIEDGKTFEANAIKKAVTVSKFVDGIVLADDSGLSVNALRGAPGVRSARFAGEPSDDKKNNLKLLKLLGNKPQSKRGAKFICVIAVAAGGKLLKTVRGECPGTIGFAPKGSTGFGYDPLFLPKGCKKTFAETPQMVKHAISHRGTAMKKTKDFLKIIIST